MIEGFFGRRILEEERIEERLEEKRRCFNVNWMIEGFLEDEFLRKKELKRDQKKKECVLMVIE